MNRKWENEGALDAAIEEKAAWEKNAWIDRTGASLTTAHFEEYYMSRPKDQDRDEPDTPPNIQTRTIAWTYQLTVKELRGWLNQIPDEAVISMWKIDHPNEIGVGASWEVP